MAPLRATAVLLVLGLLIAAAPVTAKPHPPDTLAEARPVAEPPPEPDALSTVPAPLSDKPKPFPQAQERSRDRPSSRYHRDRNASSASPPSEPSPSPTPPNPAPFETSSSPWPQMSVPNFAIRNFRIPVFLLPIYQAAGIQHGIRWEVLAAINEIETDYGRNLNVSSAGALGWMQFMPSSWRAYGVDANQDGTKDPYNPVDAIFAAARYLDAAGYQHDARRAIFAYNHADWYVDSVLLRARLIAGAPADLIASLTGLAEGRLPVADRTDRIEPADNRRALDLFARPSAPVTAVNDGVITKIGRSAKLGRHLVLRDVYGNRYTYAHLGSLAKRYRGATKPEPPAKALVATAQDTPPAPHGPASAGRQPAKSAHAANLSKQRLFAHPSPPTPPEPKGGQMAPLKPGSRVLAGTTLGRLDRKVAEPDPYLRLSIRPAGRSSPRIDPEPIVHSWELLEAAAIHSVPNAQGAGASIGQVLLMPKRLLERRVLSDRRIAIYPCGRQDIQAGRIDRRVLATLAFLAQSGLRPTVTSLTCGHGLYTVSGTVSEHASGNAVDISMINDTPILGHQEPGGLAEQTVEQLLRLQGTLRPHQIISLLQLGGPTIAMADHADHIHVGFHPSLGDNTTPGGRPLELLKASQWTDLTARLRAIENPGLPTTRP